MFKINLFTAIHQESKNKYSFYPNWHTATSDDTTNLHSEWRCTPQHRIRLRRCHKTFSGVSKE